MVKYGPPTSTRYQDGMPRFLGTMRVFFATPVLKALPENQPPRGKGRQKAVAAALARAKKLRRSDA